MPIIPPINRRCPECQCSYGYHATAVFKQRVCSQLPPTGNVRCTDCHGYNGWHANGCPLVVAARAAVGRAVPTLGQRIRAIATDDGPVTPRMVARCECGVDAAGVGGLHSSWCPRAVTA